MIYKCDFSGQNDSSVYVFTQGTISDINGIGFEKNVLNYCINGKKYTTTITKSESGTPARPLKVITLNFTEKNLTVGDEVQLNVSYNPENTTDSKVIQWKTSNENVAVVENGTVKATGWQSINNKWYYMDESGEMCHDVWVDKYYLCSTGEWIQ